MLTRLLLLCGAAVLAAASWIASGERQFMPFGELPDGFSSYGLALQFAAPEKGPQYVVDVVGDPQHPNRSVMRWQIYKDALLIPAYLAFFLIAGLIACRRTAAWRRVGGAATMLAGIAAAGF